MQENLLNTAKTTELQNPPEPPIMLTPIVASDPTTKPEILWHIARNIPEFRKWIIANPAADAAILEYISQQGGPDVKHSFEVLFAAYEKE